MQTYIQNPSPPVRDFLSEMEAEPAIPQASRFWNEIFQALTYGTHLGRVFGPAFEGVLWIRSTELVELRESLLRSGIEWNDPSRTVRYLRYITIQAAAYLPTPKTLVA